jgi:3-isopropylmalate/(R)-2-methylmalate dehydratase small subunit
MDRFVRHKGKVVPLVRDSIDTDQIMPKQFLTRIERTGFGEFVFNDLRFNPDGTPIEDFVLNLPKYKDPTILLSGSDFGCGSSREHAPWGLLDYGFRVIIAESFADIFYNNCFKTGILPITLPSSQLDLIKAHCDSADNYELEVILETQTIVDDFGFETTFKIDPFRKHCLFNGLDDIDLTMQAESQITDFENRRAANTL